MHMAACIAQLLQLALLPVLVLFQCSVQLLHSKVMVLFDAHCCLHSTAVAACLAVSLSTFSMQCAPCIAQLLQLAWLPISTSLDKLHHFVRIVSPNPVSKQLARVRMLYFHSICRISNSPQ